jgi:hypothetical protein
MAMSQAGSWRPTFPDPQPAHWICLASAGSGEVRVLSDLSLNREQRDWIARWLDNHDPREPDSDASYIYLGLAREWLRQSPDGTARPEGVTGLGWGLDFDEPPGARPSTVAEIIRSAQAGLTRGG